MEKKERRIQDNILFLGNRDDVYRLYQAMDVFVLPSRYEGLPVVGVEAQAAGLPCVLSDKMTEETKMTEGAVFMNIQNDCKNWAKCILSLAIVSRYKDAGLILSERGFSMKKRSEKLLNYYYDILK